MERENQGTDGGDVGPGAARERADGGANATIGAVVERVSKWMARWMWPQAQHWSGRQGG